MPTTSSKSGESRRECRDFGQRDIPRPWKVRPDLMGHRTAAGPAPTGAGPAAFRPRRAAQESGACSRGARKNVEGPALAGRALRSR